MRFVHWYPLAQAAAHAPRRAGVYQLRIADGLIDYPSGKSAMILYGAAPDLRSAVAELSVRHDGEAWLCRHAIDIDDPSEFLSALLLRFEQRFGAPPTLPT